MEHPLLDKIKAHYFDSDRDNLVKAYYYAEKAHENQKRASGEPYFIHPVAVADILIDLGLDAPTIAAALLHDVIEDTPATDEDIRREFGEEVLTLVSGVTKLEKIVFKSHEEEEAENFRKIFIAMAKDIRVIIIKLADRLHNMRSLNFLSKERQQRMAKETLEIYCPIAGRLGISRMKCELDDLCLKYLDPEAFEFLVVNINQKLEERNNFVSRVVSELQQMLAECNIQGEVFGRPKHFYSIYKKMKEKGKTLEQIYDLTAVRIIVSTVSECYEILGKIHERWKPIPGRIKDYIATPKANNYQSLHTTVVAGFGQPFEIQIRTEEMHRTAEYGIAAHWKYKEHVEGEMSIDQRLSWIREAMEWQGAVKDSQEFLDALKTDLYNDQLLVFTPQGKVITLPLSATPVDFAYAIHSAVGNKCTGAKVNGKIVPLSSTLETGDVVEIITSPSSKGPSRDWLKFVKSSSAKAKIKQFFRKIMQEENVKLGKSMLDEEAKRRGFSLSDLLTDGGLHKVYDRYSFTTEEDMYASIGYGGITAAQVVLKLIDYYNRYHSAPPKINETVSSGSFYKAAGAVLINGQDGFLISFAGCCSPIPGDDIVGFISRGRGVVIHRKDCNNVCHADPDRLLPAEWVKERTQKAMFNVNLQIRAADQTAVLASVSAICSGLGLSISAINGRKDKNKDYIVDISVSVTAQAEVESLMNKLRMDGKIYDVHRITS